MAQKLAMTGKLKKKFPIQEIEKKAGGTFRKRSFLIETDDKFTNEVCFDISKDDVMQKLDTYEVETEIEVFFNLSSREFNERWYHNLTAWRITTAENLTTNQKDKFVSPDDCPF